MSALPTSVASAIKRDIRNIAEQSGPTSRPDATPFMEPFADDIRAALERNAVPRALATELHKRLAPYATGLTFWQVYSRILRMRRRMRSDAAAPVRAKTVHKSEPEVIEGTEPVAPPEVQSPPNEQPPKEEPRAHVARVDDGGDPQKTRAENLREQIQHTQTDDDAPTRRQSREELL